MDQFVQTLPDGVYYTKITQKGREIALSGNAESNARVSALMRNTEASEWLTDPRLRIVENKERDKAAGMNAFQLIIRQVHTLPQDEEGEEL